MNGFRLQVLTVQFSETSSHIVISSSKFRRNAHQFLPGIHSVLTYKHVINYEMKATITKSVL
jgi:hypothetical protein